MGKRGTDVCAWQELWFLQINSVTTDLSSEGYLRVTIKLLLMKLYWDFNNCDPEAFDDTLIKN